jgi:hypothetical protein
MLPVVSWPDDSLVLDTEHHSVQVLGLQQILKYKEEFLQCSGLVSSFIDEKTVFEGTWQ